MKILASFLAVTLLAFSAEAAVVRLAPDVTWGGHKARSLKSLRGQAVVLLIAESPGTKAFRKQVRWLEETYSSLASRQVVFVAAFAQGDGPVKSNIPFVVATNGAAVAQAYETRGKFALVIIGQDGNIDYQTDRVQTGARVRDVVQNAFPVQNAARKLQP